MQKISGILPSNPRLKSVDMSQAHPIRPGVPSYGRPVGSTASARDRLTISEAAKEMAMKDTLNSGINPKETGRAKMVESMAKRFFETRLQPELRSQTPAEPFVRPVEGLSPEPAAELDVAALPSELGLESELELNNETLAPEADQAIV